MPLTVKELQKSSWQHAENKGFHSQVHSEFEGFYVRTAKISAEVGELINAYSDHGLDGIGEHGLPAVAEEAADVVIRLADFCECIGVDLEDMILKKMEYNKNRPYLHGKRTA